jgi:hypothetical protein
MGRREVTEKARGESITFRFGRSVMRTMEKKKEPQMWRWLDPVEEALQASCYVSRPISSTTHSMSDSGVPETCDACRHTGIVLACVSRSR